MANGGWAHRGWREIHKALGVSISALVAAATPLGACSSSSTPGDTPAGGAGTGGSQTAGGAANGGDGSSGLSDAVGRFAVVLNEANPQLASAAYTTVSGKVYDGTMPSPFVDTVIAEDSGCAVHELVVPFCEVSCGAGVCVADDTCKPYPTPKNVGTVSVSGITTTAGATTITLVAVSNSYQAGGDVELAYPGFNQGDPIKLSATGGEYGAFETSAQGVAPLTLGTNSYELASTSALNLTWNPPDASGAARIQVELNLSHHGGSKGYLACDVADTGSFSVPANLIANLIGLGVAGYPTLTVTRSSVGSIDILPGRVVLAAESPVSRTISVPGFASCTSDLDCPSGKVCNTDMKLCS